MTAPAVNKAFGLSMLKKENGTKKLLAFVIKMQNKAKATGIQDARLAFTDGKKYVNYLILQKIIYFIVLIIFQLNKRQSLLKVKLILKMLLVN